MRAKRKEAVSQDRVEPYMMAEAIRRHYCSLEGGGESVFDEALFFLGWHYSNCEGLKDIEAWHEAARQIHATGLPLHS